jgi:hypothetical protein
LVAVGGKAKEKAVFEIILWKDFQVVRKLWVGGW